ncbi:MAG: hypothetical protein RLP02_34715, partial [Coleofasciculus sp. C2-GNP5-27]
MNSCKPVILLFLLCLVLVGCQTPSRPQDAFKPTSSVEQQRQLDSRKFDTPNELLVLNSIVSLLQDLGFKLDETNRSAGLVSGSKRTDNLASA